jgi:trimeric autotransporter adhesin
MKKTFLSLVSGCIFSVAMAQTNTFPLSGSAGIGTTTPNTSSALEMVSTTKGLLIPRMTQAQKNAIASPANGLIIYQTNNTKGFYYYDGSWKNIPNGRLYSDSTNFAAGLNSLINDTAGLHNTAIGNYAMYSNIGDLYNGIDNTAVGFKSLFLNDGSGGEGSGSNNTAIGSFALYSNINSSHNTAIGAYSLTNLQAFGGFGNTALGSQTLRHLNSGSYNTAIGYSSLTNSTDASFNTAIGYEALYNNSTGEFNTANGYVALYSNITGENNSAFGDGALYQNSTGSNNSAFGISSLGNNNGSYNSAFGGNALTSNTTGITNTAVGYNSLTANTTGTRNTAVGKDALLINSNGSYNTAMGYAALSATTAAGNTAYGYASGNGFDNAGYNTFIGYDADASSGGHSFSTAIGRASRITGSNQVRIGNSSVTSIGGYANWSNISDGRYKKNVKENVIGLEFINKLKPVTYNLNVRGINEKTRVEEDGTDKESIAEKEKIFYSGFIAQDVEKAAKEVGYDFSGVDAPKNPDDLYGLRYAEFTVPLVKAVQELSKQNEELKNEVRSLKNNYEQLSQKISSSKNGNYSNGFLGQNIPNPFNKNTTIPFVLPNKFTSASIKIFNSQTSQTVSEYQLSSNQTSQEVNLNFSNGIYSYSLIIDGTTVDTKHMINLK